MSAPDQPLPSGDFASMNPAQKKRALAVLFIIMLIDIGGITLLIPVTPYIVARYSSDALTVTAMTAIYAAAQFFAAPLFGKLGDRYGRRPILLISLAGSALGYLIFGLGGALSILFAARLVDGLTAGNQSTAAAYIVDLSTPEERARNFGLIGLAWGVGLVLGPALGSVLGQINLNAPAFAAALIAAVSVGLIYFLLPESLPKERRESTPITLRDLNPFASIAELMRRPGLPILFLGSALFNVAFNGINSVQPLYLVERFGAEPWQVGAQLVLAGITQAIVQTLLVQRIIRQHGEKRVAIASLIGLAVAGVLMVFAPILLLVYPVAMLVTFSSSFTFPTLSSLMTDVVKPSEVGILMGVITALNSLTTVVGPLWAGFAYDQLGGHAPYWIIAVLYLLGALVLTRAAYHPRRAEQAAMTEAGAET